MLPIVATRRWSIEGSCKRNLQAKIKRDESMLDSKHRRIVLQSVTPCPLCPHSFYRSSTCSNIMQVDKKYVVKCLLHNQVKLPLRRVSENPSSLSLKLKLYQLTVTSQLFLQQTLGSMSMRLMGPKRVERGGPNALVLLHETPKSATTNLQRGSARGLAPLTAKTPVEKGVYVHCDDKIKYNFVKNKHGSLKSRLYK